MAPGTYITDVVMDDGTAIRTTVTNSGRTVKSFLQEFRHATRQGHIVGLDTEWRFVFQPDGRRTHRMAVLQLCIGRRCLVFQIVHANYVPDALRDFLACPDHRFVGVGVDGDVKRLSEDYGLEIANAVDLRYIAANVLSRPKLREAGLKTLAREVMGALIDKPKRVTMSKWDAWTLSPEQVQYACIDAFVSYEVGRLLLSGQCAEGAATGATISPSVASLVQGT
ncbi:3'-5' exonuclease-like [Phragmites australis]|uniref:3'-5' exonuclease-like n=1 Tax=Phragmites australis TaxID=29695 RepID=UPI002D7A2BB8|nr:3'-5' exonuclease-like [Phragmites australis]